MYQAGTILELKEPHEDEEFPYNRVEVVGPSPVDHGHAVGGGWEGANGQGVIIVPLTAFGATLDEPLGKLMALYNVAEVPSNEIVQQTIKRYDAHSSAAGPTPEEVFKESEKDTPLSPRQKRQAAQSPLEDPRPRASESGPLDKKEKK